jgi:IS30 family transposase
LTERESEKLSLSCQMEEMSNFALRLKKLKFMGHLTEAQRYEISAMLQAGIERKIICEKTGRDKSVLSRELKRNSDKRNNVYNAGLAQRKYEKRLREKPKHIRFNEEIKQKVIAGIKDDLSPEQIVGRSKHLDEPCVSHETVYRYVWSDKKQGGCLYKHLRNKGKKYRKRGNYKNSRGIIKNRVCIDERPEIVNEKIRFGDLETDTVIGKNHKGALLTITDRVSLMEWIVKLAGKNAIELAGEIVKVLKPFENLIHTITSDNGKEFAEHQCISELLNVGFYFAHPYKSCERGCNENANRLIRQYLPKKTDFNNIDNQYVKQIQDKLNNRPRKKLGFLTPNEYFSSYICTNKKVAFVT